MAYLTFNITVASNTTIVLDDLGARTYSTGTYDIGQEFDIEEIRYSKSLANAIFTGDITSATDNLGRVITSQSTLSDTELLLNKAGHPLNTDELPEGVNSLYFTEQRVRNAISIDPNSQNYLSFDTTTGQLSVSSLAITGVTVDSSATSISDWVSANTPINLQEGDMLILTAATNGQEIWIHNGGNSGTISDFTRIESPNVTDPYIRSLFSGGDGISYNNTTGEISVDAGTGLTFNGGQLILDDTTVSPGQYGTPDSVPTISIDQKGRITNAQQQSISINTSQITNFSSALDTYFQGQQGIQVNTNQISLDIDSLPNQPSIFNSDEFVFYDSISGNNKKINFSDLSNALNSQGSLTFTNGLSKIGNDVKLGGLLTENTIIGSIASGNNYDFIVYSGGNIKLYNQDLSAQYVSILELNSSTGNSYFLNKKNNNYSEVILDGEVANITSSNGANIRRIIQTPTNINFYGHIQIGDLTGNVSVAGMIRFNGTNFQGHDGTKWSNFIEIPGYNVITGSFSANKILSIDSLNTGIIASDFIFNDNGTGVNDIWSADKVINYVATNTGITSINGLTANSQTFEVINDVNVNVNLDIISNTNSHSFNLSWNGKLSIDRGGTNNDIFNSNEILIYDNITNSIISSGIDINEVSTNSSHRTLTNNPHNVTADQIGLGNVDNTSDATKNSAVATLTNKTINLTENKIIDDGIQSGDLIKSDGTKFLRFPIGNANEVLTVDSSGTDLVWRTPIFGQGFSFYENTTTFTSSSNNGYATNNLTTVAHSYTINAPENGTYRFGVKYNYSSNNTNYSTKARWYLDNIAQTRPTEIESKDITDTITFVDFFYVTLNQGNHTLELRIACEINTILMRIYSSAVEFWRVS